MISKTIQKLFLGTGIRNSVQRRLCRTSDSYRNVRSVILCSFSLLFMQQHVSAQLLQNKEVYTMEDTLRGSLNANRDWWDVLRYEIEVKPDIEKKEIEGKVKIYFKTKRNAKRMQVDLQQPLIVDSVKFSSGTYSFNKSPFGVFGNAKFFQKNSVVNIQISASIYEETSLTIYYHGKPKEAVRAPWDGGLTWSKDKKGNAWVSTSCQGLGASVWWPCKDHQSDEPDNGVSLTMIVPDTLIAVGNGLLKGKKNLPNNFIAYTWETKNPINTYDVAMNIGKYVNFKDTIMGEGGKLNLDYWVLDSNLNKAKEQFKQVKPMLHCFEYWFGKYPFYEDSYKLVDAPFLGMEHQSAVAYGNKYANGYLGRDLSGSGWGLKWDFIIIHESGHEWFGNNITTKDIADMWVHEGFTNYSETLYTQWLYGEEAGNDYCVGIRKNISNNIPIIGPYGVNKEGSGDMYYKAANMIHNIRHSINNDVLFRKILRGLNSTFYHKTVTTQQVENYISTTTGINFSKTFDQYLRTIQIPELEYYADSVASKITYRWVNSIDGFDMPLTIPVSNKKLTTATAFKTTQLTATEMAWFNKKNIERNYFIKTKQLPSLP